MNITVKLFASLAAGRFDIKAIETADGSSVEMICRQLGLPEDQSLITFVNSRHVDPGYRLSDRDTLAVFPLVGGG